MGYKELAPDELLSFGFAAPEVTDGAWTVRWDRLGADPAETVRAAVPPQVDFHTSGTTGPSTCWRRTRENLWREAGMLAGFVSAGRPAAVVSFVPTAHLYGALATVLLPAHLALPVWYRSSFFGAMPATGERRVVVVATPWIFKLLLQHMDWVRSMDHITVLYGGAMLPATAGQFLAAAGPERARIVEVLGSTEAGGIASRSWSEGDPPSWTLFPDVSFAEPQASIANEDGEVRLVVRSPRLAFEPGGARPSVWESDDYVQPLGPRGFLFAGRRSRLVKVNGRRINLDRVEHQLNEVLDCADLAVEPVADAMIGEHVELLVVLKPGTRLGDIGLDEAFERLEVRPRRVRVVPEIERSPLGKARHVERALTTTDAEVSR